jgi:hypothetical protein
VERARHGIGVAIRQDPGISRFSSRWAWLAAITAVALLDWGPAALLARVPADR